MLLNKKGKCFHLVGADKIIVIKDKGIIESGNHKELMDRDGEYANLYGAKKNERNEI